MSKFIGVYSTITKSSSSTSQVSNVPDKPKKKLWFVWEARNGDYGKQAINAACQILGSFEHLSKIEFETYYKLEEKILAVPLDHYTEPVLKAEDEERIKAAIQKQEAAHAKVLEIKLREKFALEIAKVRRGQIADSSPAIKNLLQTNEGITEDHVFMFTDFGIDLRKVKFYDLAKMSFERAKDLQNDDPNIWFNLARINYESREYDTALQCVDMTLKIEADHEYGLKLHRAILKAKENDNFM